MTAHSDEETPLLQPDSPLLKPARTPLPWAQLTILLVLQLAEPLTSQVISPFAPDLIRNIGITGGDETKVGYYVGLMHSIFFATQALTVLHWSRISDHLGRKPIIMTGLTGLSLSMYCFGLSRTFWSLVVSRCLNGALNGNIGVLKSMVAEITDSTNLAEAYSYLPLSWLTGATMGPMIGGSLSRPHERFPSVFGHSEFMQKYPYFLPCAIPATFSAVAVLVSFFFLKETVVSPVSIHQLLRNRLNKSDHNDIDGAKISSPLISRKASTKPLPLRRLLIPRVLVSGGNYALLAIVDICYRSVQPVYLSTPIELGGLGLSPPAIGAILSTYGISNGLLQIFFFAKVIELWGPKKVHIVGIASALPVFALFPIINLLAKAEGYSTIVWAALFLQCAISIAINFCYGSIFMYITASSPNKASLGSVNGLAQMSVSIMRAVGPALANSLFSISIDQEHHYMGGLFVYWCLAALTCVALWGASLLPAQVWQNEVLVDDDVSES
ncbi:MFS general substrate transporter [Sparassis crispa]|uniref:MFS general substrate transporter n=1 Tax=Sparassis crispa TaxID=139825 RepID=A0A401H1B7_9APHY|nr:MFS general substrate transporter [Sparassis crispa]GBE88221.1 MFS general substrate transporter [Sparassis crispa]